MDARHEGSENPVPRVPISEETVVTIVADAPWERVLAKGEPFSVKELSPLEVDDAVSHFHSFKSEQANPLRPADARIATEGAGRDAFQGWLGYEERDL